MRISDWSSDVCSSDLLAGAAAFAVRRKAMGIDDGRAALDLAHIAAQCERLPEGKEDVGREAVGDHGVPEDQHVDPGITLAGLAVARPLSQCLRRTPRLHTGDAADLQLRRDILGERLQYVCSIRACGERGGDSL